MSIFDEGSYENAVLSLLENLGYEHLYGPDVERDYTVPYYQAQLAHSLMLVNPTKPASAIDEAIRKVRDIDTGTLVQKNEKFMDYLQNGVEVSYMHNGETVNDILYLIDYAHPDRNTFQAINQWTFVEKSEKRADIIVFVNGLPLVLVELKSPSREETDASAAYRQIRNYIQEIPSLFIYNVFCVMSDMALSKAGTITSKEDRFMEWKTRDGLEETKDFIDYDTFFVGMFKRDRFLDLIKNFTCFSVDEAGSAKNQPLGDAQGFGQAAGLVQAAHHPAQEGGAQKEGEHGGDQHQQRLPQAGMALAEHVRLGRVRILRLQVHQAALGFPLAEQAAPGLFALASGGGLLPPSAALLRLPARPETGQDFLRGLKAGVLFALRLLRGGRRLLRVLHARQAGGDVVQACDLFRQGKKALRLLGLRMLAVPGFPCHDNTTVCTECREGKGHGGGGKTVLPRHSCRSRWMRSFITSGFSSMKPSPAMVHSSGSLARETGMPSWVAINWSRA